MGKKFRILGLPRKKNVLESETKNVLRSKMCLMSSGMLGVQEKQVTRKVFTVPSNDEFERTVSGRNGYKFIAFAGWPRLAHEILDYRGDTRTRSLSGHVLAPIFISPLSHPGLSCYVRLLSVALYALWPIMRFTELFSSIQVVSPLKKSSKQHKYSGR